MDLGAIRMVENEGRGALGRSFTLVGVERVRPMPMKLSDAAIKTLQKKYDYLINYDSSDPTDPIDPLTYVDSNGDNLMHIAAQLGDEKTIALLVDANMDINQKGDMGSTVLHYAYNGKHLHLVEFLLAHGASAEIENEFGKRPGQ